MLSEVLSSDEDEKYEIYQKYLEKLQEKVTKASVGSKFNVTAYVQAWSGIMLIQDSLLIVYKLEFWILGISIFFKRFVDNVKVDWMGRLLIELFWQYV